jgi:hypothetical protein
MATTRSPLQDLLMEERVVAAIGFAYLQSDVPAGMRLDAWHFARKHARRDAAILARHERRRALVSSLRRGIGRR